MKGKLANGVRTQYSHTTSERGVSSITNADAHTSAASSRLNWLPPRFKWTRPFRRKTKSGSCACAIRFRTSSTFDKDKVQTSVKCPTHYGPDDQSASFPFMHSTELFHCAGNPTHTLKYVATENFSQTFTILNLQPTVKK